MSIQTINDIYALTIGIPRPAAMKYKKDGRWIDTTVPEFEETVRHFSTGLRALGVKLGDRVAILSENRPEWAMGDFAILAACGVSVPIYPTLLGWQIEYIINDSGAVAVIASTQEQLDKIKEIQGHCPSVHTVIVCDSAAPPSAKIRTFRSIVEDGARIEAKEGRVRFDELLRSRGPEDLATIVYTSGTTGNPKGAMLSHGNIASNVVAAASVMPIERGDMALSILPLSHILERTCDYSYFYRGVTIAYAESVLKVGENLQEIKPDIFAAVPRLFEKMQARIMDGVAQQPAKKQKIFHWALRVGAERLPYRLSGRPMPLGLRIKSAIADKLVFGKILARLGGRVRFVLSGGAPLSAELAAFFVGAGLDILEGYGLTETSPVIALNTMKRRKLGTVGPLIPGVEVKIAADGEILSRGPHIMKGYFNNPEATAQAIDKDGWFHTGDIGSLEEGFLKITDRKKDLIINAYGKNIAPQPLEGLLKSSPLIGTPVLIGDRRRYLSALIIPNFEKLERDAREAGVSFASREELIRDDKVRTMFQVEIDRFNDNLDRQERIRRFTLLPNDFTIESGEMTPSMKVKRKVVDEKFKGLIDEMYRDEANVDAS